jgi:hypothetical protein
MLAIQPAEIGKRSSEPLPFDAPRGLDMIYFASDSLLLS